MATQQNQQGSADSADDTVRVDTMQDRHVLVGFDGSECGRQALAFAADEARYRGISLVVLTACDIPDFAWLARYGASIAYSETITADQVSDLRKAAEAAVAEVISDAGNAPAARIDVVTGPAAFELIDASKSAELLVVGSHGRGGFRGMLLGSVSHQCVLHAQCPVVVVRADTVVRRGSQTETAHADADPVPANRDDGP